MAPNPLRVLFATSEVFPLVKTGGLADISYALPKALQQMGVDVRVLMPAYPVVKQQLELAPLGDPLPLFSHLNQPPAQLLSGYLPDTEVPLYAIDSPNLFGREGGPYQDSMGNDWADNALRFGVLSHVAARFGTGELSFQPQILHCNDWQTGLAPAYLHYAPNAAAKTVISLHNVAYQGVFSAEMRHVLELPPASFSMYGLEYYGLLSFLKAGIYYANWVSTVSPTYAQEIQTEAFGYGLAGLLASRQAQLTGILNGIDDSWNPATDPYLPHHFHADDMAGKAANKQALCLRLGLAQSNRPLIGLIGRLTYQKGLDLVLPVLQEILAEGAQIVLLGSGDKGMEQHLRHLAQQHSGQLSVTIGYDEALAHHIEAGADLFLMPSRFEPCGLNQMYSMRYGTLPIVRHTGGLADTVVDVTPTNLAQQQATGFVFSDEAPAILLNTVQRALVLYQCPTLWQQVQQTAMRRDCSWSSSAGHYIALYQQLLAN